MSDKCFALPANPTSVHEYLNSWRTTRTYITVCKTCIRESLNSLTILIALHYEQIARARSLRV